MSLTLVMLAINCGAPMVARAAPAATARSAAFDGKVEIDARLARYPKFRAILLAESKHELALQKKEADEMRRTDRATFGRSKWTFARKYVLRADTERYVSVVRIDDTYSGGAHPNTSVFTALWDKAAERVANPFALFADMRAGGPGLTTLASLVRAALAREKKARGADVAASLADDEWLKTVEPDVEKMGRISLAPSTVAGKSSGLTFHFSPYEVGPYAEGPYTAFVPASALQALLKPEMRPLFGGERPAGDAKEE
ncbi:MAG: DUF3298 domain-containing protein [Variibacter sp.]|nr:DUF3298 domain-containing protein [Variibacter sp.]